MRKSKQIILASLFFLFVINLSYSQQQRPNCNDLISYVRENGRNVGTIKESEIINSSWLKRIEGFSINGNTVVIANIYLNKQKVNSQEYIFCGISAINWDIFYGGRYQVGLSLGEKFHEYIFEYKCNCE